MTTENMNKGLQILLERIKSNPEEFTPDITGRYPDKWRNILQQVEGRANDKSCRYLDFLSDAEIAEVWRAIQDVRGDQFTKQVMNTLLRDGVELSFSSYQAPSETKKRARAIKQIVEGELNKTFEQVYANHPVYGTPR
jgi:hypothetical protein